MERVAAIIGLDGAIGGFTPFVEWVAPQLRGAKQRDFALTLGPVVTTPDEETPPGRRLGAARGARGREHDAPSRRPDRPMKVAVVGAGVMGCATAWALRERGADVTLFEQFEPGHVRGSSHGQHEDLPARVPRAALGRARRRGAHWLASARAAGRHGPARAHRVRRDLFERGRELAQRARGSPHQSSACRPE